MTAATYGLIAAWAILLGYGLTLLNREKRLKRERAAIQVILPRGVSR
jgi:hypothetical protein